MGLRVVKKQLRLPDRRELIKRDKSFVRRYNYSFKFPQVACTFQGFQFLDKVMSGEGNKVT